MMRILSRSEAETLELGRRIGRRITAPRVVLLIGELGSGKTVLARGLSQGLGVEEGTLVHSPSFTLVNEYPSSRGTIFHLDLYRLETLRDLYSIGIEDILAAESVVIVEWAEKLTLGVENPLRIEIHKGDRPQLRVFEIHPDQEWIQYLKPLSQ